LALQFEAQRIVQNCIRAARRDYLAALKGELESQ